MSETYAVLDGKARTNQSEMLRALQHARQNAVAKALGVSTSTVSRMKERDLPAFAKMLAACGLKVVPESHVVFEPQHVAAILNLASQITRGDCD